MSHEDSAVVVVVVIILSVGGGCVCACVRESYPFVAAGRALGFRPTLLVLCGGKSAGRPAGRARTPRLHPLVYQSMRVAAAARAHGAHLARATCSGSSARPASAGRPLPRPFPQLHGWRSATRPPPITTTSFTYRVLNLFFIFSRVFFNFFPFT